VRGRREKRWRELDKGTDRRKGKGRNREKGSGKNRVEYGRGQKMWPGASSDLKTLMIGNYE